MKTQLLILPKLELGANVLRLNLGNRFNGLLNCVNAGFCEVKITVETVDCF